MLGVVGTAFGRDRSAVRRETETAQQARLEEESYQSAIASVCAARLRHELAMAHVNLFQKTAECAGRVHRWNQVQHVRGHLADLAATLATVPVVSTAQLKSIQKQEGRCSNAEAALQAMAAGVEVLASDCPVRVGDRTLDVGQSEVLTEDTEIVIGDSVRLRIKPGGGTSLSDARATPRRCAAHCGNCSTASGSTPPRQPRRRACAASSWKPTSRPAKRNSLDWVRAPSTTT